MKHRGLIWQIFPCFVAVAAATVAVTVWYSSRTARSVIEAETQVGMECTVRLLAEILREVPPDELPQRLEAWIRRAGASVPYRLTVIQADGTVLADTEEAPARMENHADRAEVQAARQGRLGRRLGTSPTLRRPMLYVAVPIRPGDPDTAVCRASAPLQALDSQRHAATRRVAAAAVVSVLLGALVSLWLSRRLTAPVAAMQAAADRLAQGDLAVRLEGQASRELHGLATSVNAVALELAERIRSVTRQKEEAEAILASMAEGVIALDAEATVLRLNQAAADILGVEPDRLRGRSLREAVRSKDLHDILDRALAGQTPAEGDVVLRSQGNDIQLQVRASSLSHAAAGQPGAVVVLHDVTRLKRLETMRRDFAANVSHEMRTPITSIKGFVETLLDGALDERADAERFLGIILQQTERLNALINDLLALAGLERDNAAETMVLTRQPLRPILAEAVQSRAAAAGAKQITVDLDCPEDLACLANPGLLQQAVLNLLDNAIAYSEPATRIAVRAALGDGDLRIAVADQGRGIAAEHLERIFERFYRIDRARSRDAGGTGLGLAITKHIVQAHKGRILVDSTPGKGSTFTIVLPRA
ncbi:MAG: PAS domain-containing protein [Lentisphaerae bacterium]|nr:PAS domain-containing protein [Lentisphaerota bacterium]